MASLQGSTIAFTFRPNKGFNEVPAFFGEKDQDWLDWLQLSVTVTSQRPVPGPSKFLGIPEELIKREVILTLHFLFCHVI